MPIDDQLKHTVGRALGKIPSGLFILSAVHEGLECAQLASWVQQAAFDPPSITVALASQRQASAMIRASGLFALSILAETDHALMKKYARGVEPGPQAFEGVRALRTPHNLPVLADSLAWLECRLLQTCHFNADHDLFIGQILAAQLLADSRPFLHVRGSGFHY